MTEAETVETLLAQLRQFKQYIIVLIVLVFFGLYMIHGTKSEIKVQEVRIRWLERHSDDYEKRLKKLEKEGD